MEGRIAVFDSGVGGLSTLGSLVQLMPFERFLYFADNANSPYGKRGEAEIKRLAGKCMEKIFALNPKAVVIACNTVTSLCVKELRETNPSQIIVGIQPAVKPALAASGNKKTLVFVTLATACNSSFKAFADSFKNENVVVFPLIEAAGLIERGCDEQEFCHYLRSEICGIHLADFSSVVLGCTHFALMKHAFEKVFVHSQIFDGNIGTAKMAMQRLQAADLLTEGNAQGSIELFLTDDTSAERKRFIKWLPLL